MQVHVDLAVCQSHGQCVFGAPDVFSFDDDQLRYSPSPPEERRADVIRAASACPVRAITVGPSGSGRPAA